MQGFITIQTRNVNTLELENDICVSNIISDNFIRVLLTNTTAVNFKIGISDAIFKPSLYPSQFYTNATNGFYSLVSTTAIASVPSVMFIDKTSTSSAMLQFSTRIAPPTSGTTRTIKTVALTDTAVGYSNPYYPVILAYSELATPCIQTSSQVYDIYYRILLDYVPEVGGVDEDVYLALFKSYTLGNIEIVPSYSGSVSPFPLVTCYQSDSIYVPSVIGGLEEPERFDNYITKNVVRGGLYQVVELNSTTQLGFNNSVGKILNGYYHPTQGIDPFGETGGVFSNVLFNADSKIQTVFGFNTESTNRLSPQFLDIENLATGSGSIALSGAWIDTAVPGSIGLYYKTSFPRKGVINISTSGLVGVSKYTYTEQVNLGNWVGTYTPLTHVNNVHKLYPLTAFTGTSRPYSNDKNILGDISSTQFGVEQISATIKYDETSVVLVKRDHLVVYSVPGSCYWRITGNFTDIHQIAVLSGVIFIACRATGLYKCDPRVTLVATTVVVQGYRTADFSECSGVAVGYSNTLWAIGKDAIAQFNGSSWNVYDTTTTPSFGVDNTHYNKIGYLKVDSTNPHNQMLLVYNAIVDTPILGMWWSTNSQLIETGNQPPQVGFGSPKLNKTHVGGIDGFWHVISQYGYLSTTGFGDSSFGDLVSVNMHPAFGSLLYIAVGGVNRLVILTDITGEYVTGNSSTYCQTFVHPNGTVEYQQTPQEASVWYNWGSSQDIALSTMQNSVGYVGSADMMACIMLENGVCFSIKKSSENTGIKTTAVVVQTCLNNTPHGGSYREVTRNNYGWSGSTWVLNSTTSKFTHSISANLLNGVSVRFIDGTSGSSFNVGNFYKFGLNRGLLKDNATRATIKIPVFLSAVKTGIPELTSTVVPVAANLQLGLVGIHPTFKSKDVAVNIYDQIVFPGNVGGQFAVGNKSVNGNFQIDFPCVNILDTDNQQTIIVGVGKAHLGALPMIGLCFVDDTTCWVSINDNPYDPVPNMPLSFNGIIETDVLSIRRVGGVFMILKNNVIELTISATVLEGTQRLDVIYYVTSVWKPYFQATLSCPPVTIVTNGSDNGVTFGNAVTGTESFDLTCKGVCVDAPISGTLGGVVAPVITSGALPVPGQIALDPDTMVMTFNSADVGKSIGINCTRYWSR